MILKKDRLTYTVLEGYESKFRETLVDGRGNQWVKKIPVYDKGVGIKKKDNNFFYEEQCKKERIVLHATHGVLAMDVANLSKQHVSTPYVIARDGTVYELFDPKYWSYHLGSLGRGYWTSNTTESKKTIGIELSNIGDLSPHKTKQDILLDAWGYPYCMKEHKDLYEASEYRGKSYFATYTDEQYKSLDSLLLSLCRRFDIVHSFLPKAERFEKMMKEPNAGIISHANYRSNKVDVSPAFDFSRISGR